MRLIPVALVVFVSLFAVSQVLGQARVADDRPPYYLTDAELDRKLGIDARTEAQNEFVQLVYFHRVPGCLTCQVMAKYIYETVEKHFADEVKSKQIVLRFRNLDEARNAELMRRLNVRSPMLAIIQMKDGRMVRAKLADRIWSLAAEKDKFIEYVEKEIKSYLPEAEEK